MITRAIALAALILFTIAIGGRPAGDVASAVLRLDQEGVTARPARGPLRVLPDNRRYFADDLGRAVLLTGSHTWDNRQDIGVQPFAWAEYLDRLQRYNHNFVRLWVWEQPAGLTTWPDPADPAATITPDIFRRTGPGSAADGRPKFDLTRFNDAYFDRLRRRVTDARDGGFYVSIMLFNGWSIERKAGGHDPWTFHPFNRANNVNDVDGDPGRLGNGSKTHSLAIPSVTRIQESYVRRVVDTVGDLDNVMYEISNESGRGSEAWQYHMIGYVKAHEMATVSAPHPVGMTVPAPNGSNSDLLESPADWISPDPDGGYRDAPPPASGEKVILSDTDHLWGIGGDRAWAWKSFTRGLNVLYMDPWDSRVIPVAPNQDLRRNLGYVLHYSRRVDLGSMKPAPQLASTRYCLADPGNSYLIYAPAAGDSIRLRVVGRLVRAVSPWITRVVEVDLSTVSGTFSVEWFNPTTAEILRSGTIAGGGRRRLAAPFAGDAVLYLSRRPAS